MDTLKAMVQVIAMAIAVRIAMGILFYSPPEKETSDKSD